MRFYGKAECAAKQIVDAFRTGNLPKALAPFFINRKDDVPCRRWSWSNQLLAALAGHSDARGYRQWQAVGRNVTKGQRSFQILVPLTRKVEENNAQTGEKRERIAVYGFKSAAVFGLSQTEGEPLPPADPAVTRWIESLPLVDVARSWGLSVEAYTGRAGGAYGKYRLGQSIALGVKNHATWAHELIHAADHRLGNLKEYGQHWRSETVAQLGGAVLLECLGHSSEADRGGCWDYIAAYANAAGVEPVTACTRVLKRTCDAVALLLDTAAALRETEAAPAV